MVCPKCRQPTSYDTTGRHCALCGFDLLPLQRRVRFLHIFSFGMFASTLVYAGLVYFLEIHSPHAKVTSLQPVLSYAFLVMSVLSFGFATNVLGRRLQAAGSTGQVQTLFITRLALVESICIYGLVLYLMGGALEWFVTFLGLCLLAFAIVGSRLPMVVRKLEELSVQEAGK